MGRPPTTNRPHRVSPRLPRFHTAGPTNLPVSRQNTRQQPHATASAPLPIRRRFRDPRWGQGARRGRGCAAASASPHPGGCGRGAAAEVPTAAPAERTRLGAAPLLLDARMSGKMARARRAPRHNESRGGARLPSSPCPDSDLPPREDDHAPDHDLGFHVHQPLGPSGIEGPQKAAIFRDRQQPYRHPPPSSSSAATKRPCSARSSGST